ncbi:beta-hydroxyacyl-ACP dehydratase [bacterium]|nr:beta-hydroxyacyl-ACP dehydratase [bacterium]
MRFVLVDRILELQPNESIRALKNLSLAEEYLADHFPGFPVLPGVMMLEALVQAGAWLIRESEEFRPSTILLKQARALKYNSFVTPGKSLLIQLTVRKHTGPLWEFQGQGTVDGESAVSARLTLEAFNLADKNPELAASDELRRQHARELFQQIRPQ